MLRIRCPHCQAVLDIHPSYAGQFIACSKCGKGLNVPAASAAPSPPGNVPVAAPAATSSAALAHNLPGSGTVTGEPNSLQEMPCDPLPADAQQAVGALGQPICSIKTKSLVWAYYVGAGAGALGLFALIFGIIGFIVQRQPVASRVAPLVLGIVFLLLGVACVVAAWVEAKRVLWLCPQGLIWQIHNRVDHGRWDQVQQLYILVAHVTIVGPIRSQRLVYRYKLRTGNGFRMQLHSDELFGTRTVGEFIQEQSTQALLPLFRQRLHQGETLDFGGFRLDRQALGVRGMRLPWPQVSHLGLDRGTVVVETARQGPRITTPMDQVSHVLIFLKLADEMSAAGRGPGRG
jgi:hypothetical protein